MLKGDQEHIKNDAIESDLIDDNEDIFSDVEHLQVLAYQDSFDIIAWFLSYFDFYQEVNKLPNIPDDTRLSIEQFKELSELNHLSMETSEFIKEGTVKDLQGSIPLLLIGKDSVLYVILEQTIAHWRVFDPHNRTEKYLSSEDLIKLKLLEQFHVSFKKPQEEEIVIKKGFLNNWIVKEVFKYKGIYRDALLASVIINLIALFIPLYTMSVYDKVVPNLAFDTLWVLTTVVMIGLLFDWILKSSRAMLTDKVGQHIDIVLSTRILTKILNSKSENSPNSIGSFAKQFQDFEGVRDFLNSMTITAIVDLPFTILFLLVIFIVGGPLVLAPAAVMLLMLFVTLSVQPKISKNIKELSKFKSERSGLSFEALQQMDTLKLNNGKQWILNRWESSVNQCADGSLKNNQVISKLNHTTQSLQQWLTIAVVVTGVYLISQGDLTMGGLIAVTMLSGRSVSGIMQITTLITRWQQAKEGMNSINDLLQLPAERPSADEIKIERRSFYGDLKFHNVSFQYPGSDSVAIKNINLTIQPGERIAILGGNGAGKTTFLKLLQSIYLPTQGRLLYDNLEAKYWDVDLLRKHIATCDQHPHLLKESIYKNITINTDGSVLAHHLAHALKQSGLDIILEKIEGGLEKKIGEGNVGLSGGQVQSVALARAFYKRANLLILDEPTSMMDKNTELRVFTTLKAIPKTTTIIISTHNIALLSVVDRVIVLDQGSIKYDGSADNLRKKDA
ncbi:ATP-binding cassette domain-containing protein [Vibrio splendidus]|uniref:ATP-binding cassette domain-containing protein n=1 Tax=Vibrio splendidus TaxID=29497 RepID=UPI002468DD8C|nr:ATP-binding cassette domain-containing protein [Vibrio splendidus]MDH5939603.1 ATP-binding cassette domain-containing protein [Vibrio splendidus]